MKKTFAFPTLLVLAVFIYACSPKVNTNNIDTAGKNKVIAIEREEAVEEVIIRLSENGVSPEIIAKATLFPLDQILQIIEDHRRTFEE